METFPRGNETRTWTKGHVPRKAENWKILEEVSSPRSWKKEITNGKDTEGSSCRRDCWVVKWSASCAESSRVIALFLCSHLVGVSFSVMHLSHACSWNTSPLFLLVTPGKAPWATSLDLLQLPIVGWVDVCVCVRTCVSDLPRKSPSYNTYICC